MANPPSIVQLSAITKRFPNGTLANDEIDITVLPGTIHAIIGENGAGKSTLMNILYGRIPPSAGAIHVDGQLVAFESPKDAIAHGIGMVAQQSSFISEFTLIENLLLGFQSSSFRLLKFASARKRACEVMIELGIELNLNAKTSSLSVSSLQKAEIVRALFLGARLLILDEPTSALSPIEAHALFVILRKMTASGTTVIFVTHKLQDVLVNSDHVTVLRNGRSVANIETRLANEQKLLSAMIGKVTNPAILPTPPSRNRGTKRCALELQKVSLNLPGYSVLTNISIKLEAGEILGIAGVDGSGQNELAALIIGVLAQTSGKIEIHGQSLEHKTVSDRIKSGIAFVHEDRHRYAMMTEFTLWETLLLGSHRKSEHGGGLFINRPRAIRRTQSMIEKYSIRASNPCVEALQLSGGNQQKLFLARAIETNPKLLLVMQPTRGLDVIATEFIYTQFKRIADAGTAILMFSLDLDELMTTCDRITVMHCGRMAGVIDREKYSPEVIGALMVGSGPS